MKFANIVISLRSLWHNFALGIISLLYKLVNFLLLGQLPALVSVATVIFENQRVLLINRTDGKGYSLPGGFVNSWEDLLSAVERETKEETGLVIKPHKLIGIYSGTKRDPRIPNVAIIYSARITSGELKPSGEGTPEWHKLDGALPKNLAFDTLEILERFGSDPEQGLAITDTRS